MCDPVQVPSPSLSMRAGTSSPLPPVCLGGDTGIQGCSLFLVSMCVPIQAPSHTLGWICATNLQLDLNHRMIDRTPQILTIFPRNTNRGVDLHVSIKCLVDAKLFVAE